MMIAILKPRDGTLTAPRSRSPPSEFEQQIVPGVVPGLCAWQCPDRKSCKGEQLVLEIAQLDVKELVLKIAQFESNELMMAIE